MVDLERLRIKTKLFRGLADPTRLAILELFKEGEKSVTEIVRATGQSQSNVSNHLRCLLECGLVKNQQRGRYVYYTIGNEEVNALLEHADKILHEIFQNIFYCVRYNE